MGGGDLQTHSGEVEGAIAVQGVQDGFFTNAVGIEALLVEEPILVTTLIPVRDVASGDGVAKLGNSGNDFVIGDTVFEHLVDEIAVGPRE